MEIKYATIPFELKAEDATSERGMFEGYGSVFGNVDFGGDIVRAGAFTKSLLEWQAKGELPQLLYYHESRNIIGDWLTMSEDAKGLKVSGKLWINGEARLEDAVRAHNVMRGTGPKGLSIGYSVVESEVIEFNGGMIREIIEVKLFEVSVAPFAMNEKADVTGVKKNELLSKREVEKKLRDAGFSRESSKAILAGGYEALERDAKRKVDAVERDAQTEDAELITAVSNLTSIFKD